MNRSLARSLARSINYSQSSVVKQLRLRAYIRFIQPRDPLIRITEINARHEVFRTGYEDAPELASHESLPHPLDIGVTAEGFGGEVVRVDFGVHLLTEEEGEVIC